jgi:hypothetical protein
MNFTSPLNSINEVKALIRLMNLQGNSSFIVVHLIELALVMTEIELPLTTCVITSITKLAEPVMTRSHVSILFSGSLRQRLHTTPHTALGQGPAQ